MFDLKAKRNNRPLEAMKWYWKQLHWPSSPSESNRGVSWFELYVNFVAATGICAVGSSHSSRSSPKLSKDALSSLSVFLEARSGISPFKGMRSNVTSPGLLASVTASRGSQSLQSSSACRCGFRFCTLVARTRLNLLGCWGPPKLAPSLTPLLFWSLPFGRASLAYFLLPRPAPSEGRVFPPRETVCLLLACLPACLMAARLVHMSHPC